MNRNSKQLETSLEGLMSASDGPQSTRVELVLSREELLESNENLGAYIAELQGKVQELSPAREQS